LAADVDEAVLHADDAPRGIERQQVVQTALQFATIDVDDDTDAVRLGVTDDLGQVQRPFGAFGVERNVRASEASSYSWPYHPASNSM
jgi:hypothetical protein